LVIVKTRYGLLHVCPNKREPFLRFRIQAARIPENSAQRKVPYAGRQFRIGLGKRCGEGQVHLAVSGLGIERSPEVAARWLHVGLRYGFASEPRQGNGVEGIDFKHTEEKLLGRQRSPLRPLEELVFFSGLGWGKK